MMNIFIAGHNGMVGSAIKRALLNKKNIRILTKDRTHLDLMDKSQVFDFFKSEKIDQIYMAAAKVGGIYANNSFPADFIFQNLTIQNNIIDSAYKSNIKKILFLGSSCIYPKLSDQPIHENALLTGSLENTNEPYAIAKIAGIKMCESYNRQFGDDGIDYRCLMPTNLYGPGDNYHYQNSHVIPSLIRKFHEAKLNNSPSVEIWGTGNPLREFLHVDDLANACIYFMNLKRETLETYISDNCSHINIGSGFDISIAELAKKIKSISGFSGEIKYNSKFPDGTPRKLLDITRARRLGWTAKISLDEGLKNTYSEFKSQYENNTFRN